VSALADAMAAVHEERGPLPAGTVAVAVRKRKADVIEVYRANLDRFVHTGKTKASRWDVRRSGPPPEVFRDAVYQARRSGKITGAEALELLIAPSPHVLARFEAVA
jgi:hypothetical protein